MRKTKVQIIYEDETIIVVNKPSGVSVTKDRSGQLQLLDILTDQLGRQQAHLLRLVHRLDKQTSGVMILAKSPESQSLLSSLFAKRLVKKTYLAIVSGTVPAAQGIIDKPLARNRKNPALMRVDQKRGKQAITNWKLLADFGSIALLAVSPLTGRTHQIRVHLPTTALPLVIDPSYGSNKPLLLSDFKHNYRLGKRRIEKPLIDRLTLHAYQFQFSTPHGSIPDCFVATLDNKFKATVKMLTKHNPRGLNAFLDPTDFDKIINGQRLC